MAPTLDGYWGRPTSTIDWCEENYDVTYYIAEFWNTVSNLAMIVPPLVGAVHAALDGLERRYVLIHLSLLAVGIGSWFFHMTLLYEMQLLDELPMIWGTCVMVYCMSESHSPPRSHNYLLGAILTVYATIVTIAYLHIKDPVFHQWAYGILAGFLTLSGFYFMVYKGGSKPLALTAGITYLAGFILWNIDNIYCDKLRYLRGNMISPLRPMTQLHGWWHVLAGIGTFMSIIFISTIFYPVSELKANKCEDIPKESIDRTR
ncbi:alkaline ceramidase 3-like [Glandiceps talaboti]